MAFSGALTLTDLNDFITPAQACIKPVEEIKRPEDVKEPGAASTQIHVDSSGSYYEVSDTKYGGNTTNNTSRKLETAQISLNDCLACSGCITSAESVLITLQSHEEVFKFLANNPPTFSEGHRIPVLSISPQSLASLATSISSSSTPATLAQVLDKVRAFCWQELGFTHVYDTTFARHIALLEHFQEFQERRRSREMADNDAKLPMLSSACPGWVCYAEKTHAEMLPFISRTKSPQQVMGTLVKSWLGAKWGKLPSDIYHITVMPCYDKKLEASRQDFYSDLYSTRDVDCVITTGELELMMREKGYDLSAPFPSRDIAQDEQSADLPDLLSHPGSSSGSYLHSLVTEHLTEETELTTRIVRTSDYEEFIVTRKGTGEVIFKGAKCYGFRNLQNVVRKVGKEAGIQVGHGAAGRLTAMRAKRSAIAKRGKGVDERERGYDYVEVMACPSGCVNGGGQIKPRDGVSTGGPDTESDIQGAKWGNKEWTKKVEHAYWHDLPTPPSSPPRGSQRALGEDKSLVTADELAWRVLRELCKPKDVQGETWGCQMDEDAETRRRTLFRTQYRAVESDVVGLQVKW